MLVPTVPLEYREAELVLDSRAVKGIPDAVPAGDLGTRIGLGIPVSRSLLEAAAELAASDPGHAYTQVSLGVTFSPAEGESIREAWVMVRLATDPGAEGGAIAWSMTPNQLATPLNRSGGIELSADLKFVSVGINRERSTEGQEVWLQALNIRRSDPAWEFRHTTTTRVAGQQTMELMVRSPVGVPVRGRLEAMAKVRRRHLKVFPYRVLLADSDNGEFEIARSA